MNDSQEVLVTLVSLSVMIAFAVFTWKKANKICMKNDRPPICSWKTTAWLAVYYLVAFVVLWGIDYWLENNFFVLRHANTELASMVESIIGTILTEASLQYARDHNIYSGSVMLFIVGTLLFATFYFPGKYFIRKSGSVAAGLLALLSMTIVANFLITTAVMVIGIIAVLIMARMERRGNRTYFRPDGVAVNVTTTGDGKEVHTWTEHD